MDQFDFPKAVGFDDSPERPRRTANVTPGRIVVLVALLLGLGLFSWLTYQVGPKLGEGMGDLLRPNAGQRAVLAERYLRRGLYDRALAESEQAIEMEPELLEAYEIKAHALTALNRRSEAIETYDHLLETQPDRALFLNNRAYMRALERVDLEEAFEDIERALEIEQAPSFIDTRGYLHYLFGRYDLALADFDAVLNHPSLRDGSADWNPEGVGEVYFHRGLVYRKLGKDEEAERNFDRARRLGFRFENYPEPVVADDGAAT